MRDGAAEIQEDLPGHIKWPFQSAWLPQSSTLLKMSENRRTAFFVWNTPDAFGKKIQTNK